MLEILPGDLKMKIINILMLKNLGYKGLGDKRPLPLRLVNILHARGYTILLAKAGLTGGF